MTPPEQSQHFVAAVESLFATMLDMPVTCSDPRIKGTDEAWLDITGTIGIAGAVSGTMALSFDRPTAEAVVAAFVGMAMDFDEEDFGDAIGELANIVAGNAKATLNSCGTLSITCPSVTRGPCVTRVVREGVQAVMIDCDCPLGIFRLELSLASDKGSAVADQSAAA